LALSLAVAIAGGDADISNRTFKVNSLGDAGIRIYEALLEQSENSRLEKIGRPKKGGSKLANTLKIFL